MFKTLKKTNLYPLLFFISLLVAWELLAHFSKNLLFILPSPSSIVRELFMKSDRFLFHGAATLKVVLGGSLLALLVAFPLAWIMYLSHNARLILQPLFIITKCVPMFALAPIMVVWLGWSYAAIVVPTALMIFFPLTMSLYQGLRATPPHLLNYFKSQQATKWQIFYKLQLPWALPHIFAGLRISAAAAGIGAVAGEWAGAQSGLGLLMLESRKGSDLEVTFGALFCLTVMSLSIYGLITLIERAIFRRKFVHMLPKGATAALMIGVTLFSFGCSKEETKIAPTRLILDWLPNPNHVPIYVGLEKGFFKEEGLEIDLKKILDSGSSLAHLRAGNVDLAVSYQPTVQRANYRGGNFIPIGILIPEPLNSFIYRVDSGIQKPQDLNGKSIGYSVDGTATLTLDYLLKSNNITPKEKSNISFDIIGSLSSGLVDVTYGAYWNIECGQLDYLGVKTSYFKLSEFGYPNYHELIVVARADSPQADPAFIERFQRAMQRSIDYSKAHPEESFKIYLKANPDKGSNARVWEESAWKVTHPIFPTTQKIDQEAWDNFARWIREKQFA